MDRGYLEGLYRGELFYGTLKGVLDGEAYPKKMHLEAGMR